MSTDMVIGRAVMARKPGLLSSTYHAGHRRPTVVVDTAPHGSGGRATCPVRQWRRQSEPSSPGIDIVPWGPAALEWRRRSVNLQIP